MGMRTRATAVLAGGAAAAIVGSGLVFPAQAEGAAIACHWINGEYYETYTCDDPVDAVESVEIVDCWKLPVSTSSFARLRTAEGWQRSADVTVKVGQSRKCGEATPYRTVVTIPGALLQEMTPMRVQLVMPLTVTTKRKTETYAACLMPEDAEDWCPRR